MNEKLAAVLKKQASSIGGSIADGAGAVPYSQLRPNSSLITSALSSLEKNPDEFAHLTDAVGATPLEETPEPLSTKELINGLVNKGKGKLMEGVDAVKDKIEDAGTAVEGTSTGKKLLAGMGAGLGIAGLAALWANRHKRKQEEKQASTTKEAISRTALQQIATGIGGLGLGTGLGSLLMKPTIKNLANMADTKNTQLHTVMDLVDKQDGTIADLKNTVANHGVELKDTDSAGLTKELLNRGKAKLEEGADVVADKYHNVLDAVTAPENRTKALLGAGAGALGLTGLAALWANHRKRKQEEKQASTTKEAIDKKHLLKMLGVGSAVVAGDIGLRKLGDKLIEKGHIEPSFNPEEARNKILEEARAKVEADSFTDIPKVETDNIPATPKNNKLLGYSGAGIAAGALGLAGLAALWANRRKRKQEEKQASTTKVAISAKSIKNLLAAMKKEKKIIAPIKNTKTFDSIVKSLSKLRTKSKAQGVGQLSLGLKGTKNPNKVLNFLNKRKALLATSAGTAGAGYAAGALNGKGAVDKLEKAIGKLTPEQEPLSTPDMINTLKQRVVDGVKEKVDAGKEKLNNLSTADKVLGGMGLVGAGALGASALKDKKRKEQQRYQY